MVNAHEIGPENFRDLRVMLQPQQPSYSACTAMELDRARKISAVLSFLLAPPKAMRDGDGLFLANSANKVRGVC